MNPPQAPTVAATPTTTGPDQEGAPGQAPRPRIAARRAAAATSDRSRAISSAEQQIAGEQTENRRHDRPRPSAWAPVSTAISPTAAIAAEHQPTAVLPALLQPTGQPAQRQHPERR